MAVSTALTRLMNDVRMRAPGVLDGVLQQEFFMVLDEFFRNTNVWQEDIAFSATTSDLSYTLLTATDGMVVRLLELENSDEIPVSGTMRVPPILVLNALPTQADTYTAKVSLSVIDPVDGDNYPQVPSWLVDNYRMVFEDGLLGRLMSQPAKPYSNERMAIYHMRRFRDGMSRARVESSHQNLQDGQAWRFPKGFR